MGAVQLFRADPLDHFLPQSLSQQQQSYSFQAQPDLLQQFSTINTFTSQSYSNRRIPIFTYKHAPQVIRTPKKPLNTISNWNTLMCNSKYVTSIMSYLSRQELTKIKYINRMVRKVTLVRVLQNYNNWDLTMNVLAPFLMKQTHLRMAGTQDQHSQDLDRTSGYFQSEDQNTITQHRNKLDRVITTISFQTRYFQGIMPICAFLLQCFNENTSYWLLKYLLAKSRHIQTDMSLYSSLISFLQQQFLIFLPNLSHHLQSQGFQLNYFVMKWIMGLFSQDMDKAMLLAVMDLLCQTDVYILVYTVIEVFRQMEEKLLKMKADQINFVLKCQIKGKLSEVRLQVFMKSIKEMYMLRRLNQSQ